MDDHRIHSGERGDRQQDRLEETRGDVRGDGRKKSIHRRYAERVSRLLRHITIYLIRRPAAVF